MSRQSIPLAMSLVQKTLAILFLTITGLTGVLYFTSRAFVVRNVLEFEQAEMESATERAANVLSNDIGELGKTANDYGAWDRTYAFMQSYSPDYLNEFKDETLQGLNVNSVLLLSVQGKVILFRHYHPRRTSDQNFKGDEKTLATDPWVLGTARSHVPSSGLRDLPAGPALVAACPILTTERKGPARGVLVMTRDLDENLIAHIKTATRSPVLVVPVKRRLVPADILALKSALESDRAEVTVRPVDESTVAGYKILEDVGGRPMMILRVEMPRTIFQYSKETLRYFLVGQALIGLVFGGVVLLLIRTMVLSRMTSLSEEVSRVGEQRDLSERIEISGSDEIANLGEAINTMLGALQSGDAQFHQIAANIRQVFWVRDECTQQISYIGPPWASDFGLTREQLYSTSESWAQSVHPDDRGIVEEMNERQHNGERGEAEFRVVTPEGDSCWIWSRYFPVFSPEGHFIQTFGLSEDISDYKRASETMERSQEQLWEALATAAKIAAR